MTQMLPSLWEASGAYTAALEAISEAQTTEEMDAAVVLLDQAESTLTLKADRVVGLMRECELRAAARTSEAQRLSRLAEADERRAAHLRAYVLRELQAANVGKLDTDRFRLAVRANNPAIEVLDASVVPSEYNTTSITTSVDKRRVLEDYKRTGAIPPGVQVIRRWRLDML